MRRFLALAIALTALIAAGFVWTRDRPVAEASAPPPPAADADSDDEPLVAPASNVTPADREARRFRRYDKDRDARISRDEYLAARRKAFAKLDSDGDGRLGFEEYAVTTAMKFSKADRDGDGTLAAPEFAKTALKRRETPACACKE
jgi:Ca2+-binding EF-hand superfamily protein